MSGGALQLFSWNVNGLRAVLRKGALAEFLATHDPEILCLQEIKMQPGQAVLDLPDYTEIWNSAERPGYAGTAIFTKTAPLQVWRNFAGAPELARDLDQLATDLYGDPLNEGRVLAAEFADFILVTVYTPNAKPDLSRLALREKVWDPLLAKYLQVLARRKPVVVCGDLNVAHAEIDLARPDQNRQHAGFTDAERQGFASLLAAGFCDTFRTLHPDAQRYTWWSHWGQARAKNVGWRIDYFLLSSFARAALLEAEIYESQLGSDHCPVSVTLDLGELRAVSEAARG